MIHDMKPLRTELIKAIDDVLARYTMSPPDIKKPGDALVIKWVEQVTTSWSYQWPADLEEYREGTLYDVTWATGEARVLLGRSTRRAWGKTRGRIVIFGRIGTRDGGPYYPWVEFVEADDGTYVANIPDPTAPRSALQDGDPLPPELAGMTVRRTDECFGSVQHGPTLRLVLGGKDEEAMIRHAHWVARLRGRIP